MFSVRMSIIIMNKRGLRVDHLWTPLVRVRVRYTVRVTVRVMVRVMVRVSVSVIVICMVRVDNGVSTRVGLYTVFHG